jgi:hypothetical protein
MNAFMDWETHRHVSGVIFLFIMLRVGIFWHTFTPKTIYRNIINAANVSSIQQLPTDQSRIRPTRFKLKLLFETCSKTEHNEHTKT